jgi:hypothetical protein
MARRAYTASLHADLSPEWIGGGGILMLESLGTCDTRGSEAVFSAILHRSGAVDGPTQPAAHGGDTGMSLAAAS